MKRTIAYLIVLAATITIFVSPSEAHFGMVIPSTDNVKTTDSKTIALMIRFTHPFDGGPIMHMDRPSMFGCILSGRKMDLLTTLREKKVDGKATWTTDFTVTRPGDYVFYLLPQPYWEPAEDKFIVHATKVIVGAMGVGTGWDRPIADQAGLPAEIVPLAQPYGLYAGNVFTGRVYMDGKPVPNAEVEVEWWAQGKVKAPSDSHATQVIKTDPNGVFTYAMPKAGWWGFSALLEGRDKIKKDGQEKDVEIGAVLWVQAHPMP